MRTHTPTFVVVACLALACVFFGFLGFHSYVPYDPGFVLAYSWRLWGGQVPYVDFIHLRPPLSIYLHTGWLWLPETWSFPASRLGYFVQMALAAALPASAALRVGLVSDPGRAFFLTLAFYIFALGSFPIMPWYTVDGVFFSSIALACWLMSTERMESDGAGESTSSSIRRNQVVWRSFCSLALAASALCKQPFILLPVVFALCVGFGFLRSRSRPRVVQYGGNIQSAGIGRDWVLLSASLLPGLALALVQSGVLLFQGAFSGFVEQAVLAPFRMPPKATSWMVYFSGPAWAALPGFLWPWLERRSGRASHSVSVGPVMEVVAISGLAFWLSTDQFSYTLLAFLVGQGAGRLLGLGLESEASPLALHEERIRAGLAGWVALTGFCASLSWGASTPVLGLAALGVALTGRFRSGTGFLSAGFLAALLAVVSLFWFAQVRVREPYLLQPIEHQTEPLHEVFPRFGRLWGTPQFHAQMSELKSFHERHTRKPERSFTVLRSFPLLHYLTGTQSDVSLDWYYWLEMRGYEQALTRELREMDGVLILERPPWDRPDPESDEVTPCQESMFSNSPYFLQHLYRSSTLIESGRFFCFVESGSFP